MPAPLTSHQRNLFMAKRRGGSSQEAAAAAAGISVRSARRIESNQLQPQANQPRGRTRADPLAGVWQEELVPLLQRALQHLNRRQGRKVARRPLADQCRELRGFPIQPQGLLGRSAQGAIGCPAGELQPPVLQQSWEAKALGGHVNATNFANLTRF